MGASYTLIIRPKCQNTSMPDSSRTKRCFTTLRTAARTASTFYSFVSFGPHGNLAYKIIRDRAEAEDVVQEVFLAIHQQRERFDPSVGPARTWVLQFGYYKSLKRRRYLSKRHFYEEHVRAEEDRQDPLMVQPEYVQRSVECKEIVERALATLTPAQRRIIELFHFEGRTLQEISQMEGKELTGIRNSYYRGVNALRMSFGKGVRPTVIRATEMEKRREEYEIEL